MTIDGNLRKMRVALDTPVQYQLVLGEALQPINGLLGQHVKLTYHGEIHCVHCGRKTNKSFAQGYCFPCMRSLAECDGCIVKPETCHFAAGTCRDEAWAKDHCFQPHYVYLANSSGLKVGITRGSQIPTRWIDQGATQALALFKVANRFHAGLVEVALKAYVADRTDWRKMLKGISEPIDMIAARDQLLSQAQGALDALRDRLAVDELTPLSDAPLEIAFPVDEYPAKVTSFNLDKTPVVEGTLLGIKGQYLIFDSGVINIRKFGGYKVSLEA